MTDNRGIRIYQPLRREAQRVFNSMIQWVSLLTGRTTCPWLPQLLCWLRKGRSDTISEKHGLDLVRNAWMHDRAVLEAPDLKVQTLVWHTPAHLHAADTCASR